MIPIWQPYAHPSLESCRDLARKLDLPVALAPLFCRQEIFLPEQAMDFLHPKLKSLSDPYLLPEMDKAVRRLLTAIDSGEKIVLYGDYDVDGVTSLTMLSRMLTSYGGKVAAFLPHRVDEGYGLSREGLVRCLEEHAPDLLVAVDCGTSSAKEIAELRTKNIDVIVLDHHVCSGEWPDCIAVVNPKRNAHLEYLCTGGLAFKLCHALLKLRPLTGFDLKKFLDLAALATVADLVPLVGENRLLVRRGLLQMEQTAWPGLAALMSVAGVSIPISASDIGFRLGPRLNAAGRLGTAQNALALLCTDDPVIARELAAELHGQNAERQAVEKRTHHSALELLTETEKPALVVGARDWAPGVVGIVAARLVRQFHRPSIVIAFDDHGVGKGSGRSIAPLSLVQALSKCSHLLEKYGGHDMAAGLTIREENLTAFATLFQQTVAELLTPEDFIPLLHLDCEINLTELDEALLEAQGFFEPFGMANYRPTYWLHGITSFREPVIMKEKHLRLSLQQNGVKHTAVFFGGAVDPLPKPPWDVAFHLESSTWQGETKMQIQVTHLRSSLTC